MLTYPHPLSPTAVRSTNRLWLRGSISSPWSVRPQWAPTAVSFLVATHTLIITSERSLPPSYLLFSFSSRLAASLSLAGSFVFSSASTPAFLCVAALHFSLVFYPFHFTVASALSFCSFPPRADGSKTHRRGLPSNSRGEWLGTGGP